MWGVGARRRATGGLVAGEQRHGPLPVMRTGDQDPPRRGPTRPGPATPARPGGCAPQPGCALPGMPGRAQAGRGQPSQRFAGWSVSTVARPRRHGPSTDQHTAVTAVRADVRVHFERLGHANATITLTVYQHVRPGMGREARCLK